MPRFFFSVVHFCHLKPSILQAFKQLPCVVLEVRKTEPLHIAILAWAYASQGVFHRLLLD